MQPPPPLFLAHRGEQAAREPEQRCEIARIWRDEGIVRSQASEPLD